MNSQDTIAAISTAFGNAGIAVVRISGPKSLPILKKVFSSSKKPAFKPNKVYFGKIKEEGRIIDEVLAVFFKSPKTFTGEDMAEINCHGGYITAKKILNLLLKKGARHADPGEFTKRAYLNGRIDLSQAEAIADIIYAKSDKAQEVAQNQLEGHLSDKIKKILKDIFFVYSNIAVDIDYPDEETPTLSKKEIAQKLKTPIREISELLESAEIGTIYKEGFKVAIVGLPNVGKSSLLNALVRDARAIVTEIPGTTRDVLEDQIELSGVLIRLFDTAGITDTEDMVEKEGISRSLTAIDKADLILLVVENKKDVENFLAHLRPKAKEKLKQKKVILVRNKIDKKHKKEDFSKDQINYISFCEVSAKKAKNIKKLEKEIQKEIQKADLGQDVLITNIRQKKLLENALKNLDQAIILAKKNEPEDKILIELDLAKKNLSSIIGEEVSANMLEDVFSRFCVGK